jgi:oxalate decarboxylase
MNSLSRRSMLAAGAAGGIAAATITKAATFGNPDDPPEGEVNVSNPKALTDPGPQDPGLAGQEQSFLNPPATDVNGMPQFWTSFNLAPKRIQNGGWARQITQDDFKISTSISGVNMRLGPGAIRELHWHQQAEWAVMTYGNCRVTIIDQAGRPQVADVKEGDLWYFPSGLPHSLQGLGPDGCEFVIAFDNGASSEFNTLLVTDWIAHTPPEVLAKNFGVPADAFKNIPLRNKWIYQGKEPAPLEKVEEQIAAVARQATASFRIQARRHGAESGNEKWIGADRRQHQLPRFENYCRVLGDGETGRDARHALASQCRRMGVFPKRDCTRHRFQYRACSDYRRLPRRRHRLCAEGARTLR